MEGAIPDDSQFGDDDILLQQGAIPIDQINDMYQKRANLYKNQMNKSSTNLKKQNYKNRKSLNTNISSKHINKYHQQFGSNNEETQLVIDISCLKDIDQSPQNIKELSKLIGENIGTMLTNEIKKRNGDFRNQTITNNNLKIDLTPFTTLKRDNKHLENAKVRDEKYSFDSFVNKMKDFGNGVKNEFFNKEQHFREMDKQYMTTQEEATSDSHSLQ